MAGSRPSQFKHAGGRFNNCDGTLTGYEFTDTFPFEAKNPRKGKKSDFRSLFGNLSARMDGAEEDTMEPMFAGSADDFEILEDGKVLVPVDGSIGLRANVNWCRFIDSLVAAGFPEGMLADDEIRYEPIIGCRVRFVQRVDDEATRRLGKRKDAKTGREYDRTYTAVETLYSLPGASTGAGKAKGASKPAAPAQKAAKAATKAAAGNGQATDVDLDELATETLLNILGAATDNKLAKAKLSVRILQTLNKHPQRQEVYKTLFDDAFLGKEAGWSYDSATQVLSL